MFAQKNYLSGMYYFRRGGYDSGIIYFKDVIAKWPSSPTARLAQLRLVDAYKVIRYKEDAQDTCAALKTRYPGDVEVNLTCAGVALPALVVVYLAAATLGSAVPTPGGLGAVEAALVGGLTTTGVPVGPALAAVLLFRTATFWLPAPIGWVAFVGLQRRGWI